VSPKVLFEYVERALAHNVEQRQQQNRVNAMRCVVAGFMSREAEVFA
jgi:FixJ family two-component response regulator